MPFFRLSPRTVSQLPPSRPLIPRRLFPWSAFQRVSLLLATAALLLPRAVAQATSTATKTADLSVFFGFSTVQPDYGPYRNSGGSLGIDLTRYFHFPVAPALELRANFANGSTVNERSYLVGLRAQADFLTRFHPYGDFLAGPGNIHFNFPNNGYTGDNSIVYSYGGGVDIDLVNNFGAKIDFQGQHWNTGENSTFTPSLLLIGVTYRIPFEAHDRQGTIAH